MIRIRSCVSHGLFILLVLFVVALSLKYHLEIRDTRPRLQKGGELRVAIELPSSCSFSPHYDAGRCHG
jgi:hypothetical protein